VLTQLWASGGMMEVAASRYVILDGSLSTRVVHRHQRAEYYIPGGCTCGRVPVIATAVAVRRQVKGGKGAGSSEGLSLPWDGTKRESRQRGRPSTLVTASATVRKDGVWDIVVVTFACRSQEPADWGLEPEAEKEKVQSGIRRDTGLPPST
jgi:hypothetical protein